MKRSTAKRMYVLSLIAGMVLILICAAAQLKALIAVATIIMFSILIVCCYYLRCPSCGTWPRKGTMFTSYCPCCGELLDD